MNIHWERVGEWVLRSQILGIVVGGIVTGGVNYWMQQTQQEWTKESLGFAYIGEISAIIEFQNTTYLKSLLTELEKGVVWKPLDKPLERDFIIYEVTADRLGLLGRELSKSIANFYWMHNISRGYERILGSPGYLEFEPQDRKNFLSSYIDIQTRMKENGQRIVDELH
ncbi:MAG TPA: hypothetical protein VGA50_00090 [Kiloniellales bacterium]